MASAPDVSPETPEPPGPEAAWSGNPAGAAERLAQGIVFPEAPSGPPLAPGATVFAMGPCFARGIEAALASAGMVVTSQDPDIASLGEADARSVLAHDTPEALVQELRWADGSFPEAALIPAGGGKLADPWLGPRAPTGTAAALLARRGAIARYFARAAEADMVVITLGQAEGLRDTETGLMLGHGADLGPRFRPDALSLEAVETLLEALASHLPGRIVLTVSPEALSRTGVGMDVITSNLEGKAILRLAAGRLAARHARVEYFPVLESAMVSDTTLAWRPDRRRPSGPLLGRARQVFLERYATPAPVPAAAPAPRPAAAITAPSGDDPRAETVDPATIDRRHAVQIRPYDKRDWGGPDLFAVPEHARVTVRGTPACRFPKLWTQEEDLPVLKGTYLWGGPMKVHFGHLLVDSVARLWAFDPKVHDGVIFAQRGGAKMRPWIYEILAQYGLRKKDVIVLDVPTRVETVDFARPGSALGLGPTRAYLDWLAARPVPRKRLAAPRFGEKLYLGRLHMAQKGTLMGESYFADLLQQAGFAYLEPEKHSIEDQARALREAHEVVFLEGSSVYSVELLAASAARFHMIPRREGGDALFRPHIAPRAAFSLLGEDSALDRFVAKSGRPGPSGPSRSTAPASILADMIAAGLVSEQPFDADAFRAAMRRDAEAHVMGDAERLVSLLAWLAEADPDFA